MDFPRSPGAECEKKKAVAEYFQHGRKKMHPTYKNTKKSFTLLNVGHL